MNSQPQANAPQSLEQINAALLHDMRNGDQSWRATCVDRYIAFLGQHIVNCEMRIATLRQIPRSALHVARVRATEIGYHKAIAFLRNAKEHQSPADLEPMELRMRANAWLAGAVNSVKIDAA